MHSFNVAPKIIGPSPGFVPRLTPLDITLIPLVISRRWVLAPLVAIYILFLTEALSSRAPGDVAKEGLFMAQFMSPIRINSTHCVPGILLLQ